MKVPCTLIAMTQEQRVAENGPSQLTKMTLVAHLDSESRGRVSWTVRSESDRRLLDVYRVYLLVVHRHRINIHVLDL